MPGNFQGDGVTRAWDKGSFVAFKCKPMQAGAFGGQLKLVSCLTQKRMAEKIGVFGVHAASLATRSMPRR